MKKKLLAMGIIACLLAVAVVGGSLAFFIDSDMKINTFKAGSGTDPDDPDTPDGGTLEIEQDESNPDGTPYDDPDDPTDDEKPLFPYVPNPGDDDGDGDTDGDGYDDGGNYIDKIVTVENTGREDSYVRNFVAVPTALDGILHFDLADSDDESFAANHVPVSKDAITADMKENVDYVKVTETIDEQEVNYYYLIEENKWNWEDATFTVTMEGVEYTVYTAVHDGKLAHGESTAPTLLGVYLDSGVDSKMDENGNVTFYFNDEPIEFDLDATQVLVASEAVQVEGFEFEGQSDLQNARYALDTAFGKTAEGYNPFVTE